MTVLLQCSCQEIIRLLIRGYKTPDKTPDKRLQDSYQEIVAKHNKMIEYLNFFLLCILLALIFYLHIWVERYLTLLKMAEEIFNSYDAPKRQKLLKCVLTGNSKLYLGKVFTEERLKNLAMKR